MTGIGSTLAISLIELDDQNMFRVRGRPAERDKGVPRGKADFASLFRAWVGGDGSV